MHGPRLEKLVAQLGNGIGDREKWNLKRYEEETSLMTYSLNKCLLIIYFVQGRVLEAEGTAVNETKKAFAHVVLHSTGRRQTQTNKEFVAW